MSTVKRLPVGGDSWDDTVLTLQYDRIMQRLQLAVDEKMSIDSQKKANAGNPDHGKKAAIEERDKVQSNGHADQQAQGPSWIIEANGDNDSEPLANNCRSPIPEKQDETGAEDCLAPLASGLPPMPQAASKDEALRKMLISWYYSGYHTGYYDGRNSANR